MFALAQHSTSLSLDLPIERLDQVDEFQIYVTTTHSNIFSDNPVHV